MAEARESVAQNSGPDSGPMERHGADLPPTDPKERHGAETLLPPADLKERHGADTLLPPAGPLGRHGSETLLPPTAAETRVTAFKMADDGDEMRECGIGQWRPKCVQGLANIKMFIVVISILSMISNMLSSGYLNSVITTIEKRFEIGSSMAGFIAASYEFGSLVAVIFVSYLGGRRHIPRWLGLGVVFMGIGALLFALPHVLAQTYTLKGRLSNSSSSENICKRHDLFDVNNNEICVGEDSGNGVYVFILILAQTLIGVGGTPIYTLGTTYIDNHVTREKAPGYLAFMYATGTVGPILGFSLGALLLQYYVDTFTFDYKALKLSPSHPMWVGAWWGGFIICGLLLLGVSIPFFAFPKSLRREKEKLAKARGHHEETLTHEDLNWRANYGKTAKDIPLSMLALLKNPIYLVTCLGVCCEASIISGFVIFLPKYLETQFGISKSMANLLTGVIGIPGACVGILIGGYILNRFNLKPKGAVQLSLILNGSAGMGFMFLFFLGCDNMRLAGATLPYLNGSGHQIFEANFTATCNKGCLCSPNDVSLICGTNGITYFSPCHAGCRDFYGSFSQGVINMTYTQCSCILPSQSLSRDVYMSPMATSGPCKDACRTLLPFMFMLFVMTLTVSGTQMPLLMVTMRSVAEEERAFALGMQFVVLRLFAYIPAPILFGNIIDTTCLHWKHQCGEPGSCLIYDIEAFRYKYVGVCGGLKILGAILFTAVWCLICRANKADLKKTSPVGDLVNSLNSLPGAGDQGQSCTIHRDRTQESFVLYESNI
ncbi:solute carrier organic anion transporter family member 5A1-like [Lineus longissimus]|uniref:solute carrier organic anion transporter family member 5A1-like n=1 Tax=Lineus longissimus TaxID=88925 RepID=UPI00315CC92C